jgi:ribosomal protein S6 kinase beta
MINATYYVHNCCRDENLERVELSEHTVNPGQPKACPQDFELLKLLGKGGYGKVVL